MSLSEQERSTYCQKIGQQAREAERQLRQVIGADKNAWLLRCADSLLERESEIQNANEQDLAQAEKYDLTSAQIDRLRLNKKRLQSMAQSLREIAMLPEPVGQVLESRMRPNGLRVDKIGVPLGVIFFIYESRPNVTVDAASLCVKSGNALILRGGKEALHSNRMLHEILRDCLCEFGLPEHAVQFIDVPDREVVGQMLRMKECIDLVIPRGGEGLIRRVEAEATMPVLKHYLGNCHVYVDADANLEMAERIAVNAKCQRPGVCNAAETLLVHSQIADKFLPNVCDALRKQGTQLRGCPKTQKIVPECEPASDEDYRTEYLDLILAIRVVEDLEAAIRHIAQFGSQHTECIVTNDLTAAQTFSTQVDASAVMINASTRFNDGAELGLGAEIGISTEKFHARGPCGLLELTTYKYVVQGNGHVRT